MSGLLQVRLVWAGEPVLTQTRVDRFLSSPQRVDVGMIGGEAGLDLGTLGNGPVAGDQDINVAGSSPSRSSAVSYHRKAQPVHVIGELVQIRTVDAGIDQDQPTLPAHHGGIAPDPLALPDPDAVGHLIQHRFTLSGISARRELRRP